jgi:ribose transport system substrate-binding protein
MNTMRKHRIVLLLIGLVLTVLLPVSAAQKITIGIIGKIDANPVFQAAYAGARVAARELGPQFNVEVVIDWHSPTLENANEQVSIIDEFIQKKVDAIAISCSDATVVTPAIDRAVNNGIQVITYDADAPQSKRFAYYGPDDEEFGKEIMQELAAAMEGKGTIAVLAGIQNALNLQRRLKGLKDELKKHPGIKLAPSNIYYHPQMPKEAIAAMNSAMRNNPNISGWAFIGSWVLQQKNSLHWNPGEIKAVAGNAVPAELEYVESGHVQALVGVNCFEMGYRSVDILLKKIVQGQSPPDPIVYTPLTRVTKDNVKEWTLNWRKWLLKEAIHR